MRINEYKKSKILEKIEEDNLRAVRLQSQKEEMILARKQIQEQAMKRKVEMAEKFEKMRKKGKLD
eukprot:CAMPEP_0116873528 /NCGR_PEP_ID=MMETSP0463-20121206/4707_1 /TAXON_ID=181622 /ORGANISM="Strombidinopsis sp, Strain SopsisLIS2011" /LENGTH=64 /DNA_ID=CAMNT_0004515697 /DNA_START=1527 /DNA_END=1721 /DNA_ORIENTATION=+